MCTPLFLYRAALSELHVIDSRMQPPPGTSQNIPSLRPLCLFWRGFTSPGRGAGGTSEFSLGLARALRRKVFLPLWGLTALYVGHLLCLRRLASWEGKPRRHKGCEAWWDALGPLNKFVPLGASMTTARKGLAAMPISGSLGGLNESNL